LTMINMANKKIIPAVIRYSKSLADTVIAVKDAGADASVQRDILNTVSSKLITAKNALLRLEEATAQAGTIKSAKDKAFFYKDTVKVEMDALRKPVDELELVVDKSMWPMPTYGDLTFEV
jgi:glutamine synthetase